MNDNKFVKEGLTFDDVLLIPAESSVLPKEVDVRSVLTNAIELNVPLVSAGMDTVTEARMAIAMAREGGIGIVHKNMSIEDQATAVDIVKRSENGVIIKPIYVGPDAEIQEAENLMAKYRISGAPVVLPDGKLVGILTNRDMRFVKDMTTKVRDVMTSENLVTAPEGTDIIQAETILQKHKIEKLPLVDKDGILKGLITTKDIEKAIKYPDAAKDERGTSPGGGGSGHFRRSDGPGGSFVPCGHRCDCSGLRPWPFPGGGGSGPGSEETLAGVAADCRKCGHGRGHPDPD